MLYTHFMTRNDLRDYKKRCTSPYNVLQDNGPDNIILSEEMKIGLDNQITGKNNNILLFGDSKSGKTLSYVVPNLEQMNTNYVITDMHGKLYQKYSKKLKDNGYTVLVFDVTENIVSNCYNPLMYIYDEKSLDYVLTALFHNHMPYSSTTSKEYSLLKLTLFYYWFTKPKQERTFLNIREFISNVSSASVVIDNMFSALAKYKKLENFPIQLYETLAAYDFHDVNFKNLLGYFKIFDDDNVKKLVQKDELELKQLSTTKSALFIVTSTGSEAGSCLNSLLCRQALSELYRDRHDIWKWGKQQIPVHFILDDFDIIGRIPNLALALMTMWQHSICCTLIAKTVRDVEKIYREGFPQISSSCDIVLYYSGCDMETVDWLSLSGRIDKADFQKIKEHECFVIISGEYPYKGAKIAPQTQNSNTFKRSNFKNAPR